MFRTGYRNGNSLIAIHEHTEQTKKARVVDKVFTLASVPHTRHICKQHRYEIIRVVTYVPVGRVVFTKHFNIHTHTHTQVGVAGKKTCLRGKCWPHYTLVQWREFRVC